MKKSIPVTLVLISLFALSACSGNTQTPSAPVNQPSEPQTAATGNNEKAAVEKTTPVGTAANESASLQILPASSTSESIPPKTISKTCEVPPAKMSGNKAVNASGKEIEVRPEPLYTSEVAIPKLEAAAKKWAQDARVVGTYSSGVQSFTPTDIKFRLHYGEDRGAMYSWSGTFYSPSKNQDVWLAYIEDDAGGSIPQTVKPDMLESYNKGSIYVDTSDMISSCVAYEVAKANGLDEKANYYLIMNGHYAPGQKKTWIIWEMSRTDNDNGKEPMGKPINSYVIDAVTGELLEKVPGRVYGL